MVLIDKVDRRSDTVETTPFSCIIQRF